MHNAEKIYKFPQINKTKCINLSLRVGIILSLRKEIGFVQKKYFSSAFNTYLLEKKEKAL